MSMKPVQGPQAAQGLRHFNIDDQMQVKSSWGSRIVEIKDLNTKPQTTHTIKLKELVNILEEKIKSANSPKEIKRAREMYHTITVKERDNRGLITKFLDWAGVKNDYDTKFNALNQKIISKETGRGNKIQQMNILIKTLDKLPGKIDEARKKVRKEEDENLTNRNPNGSDWDDNAQSDLDLLLKKVPEKQQELEDLKRVLIGNEVGSVQKAAYEKYDQLYNIDNINNRLMGAEIAAKEASGEKLNAEDENTMKFLESLNKIPKDLKLEINENPLLIKKKENFIANLKAESPIVRLMENGKLKELAAEMDKGLMTSKSLQNFALNIVGVHPEDMKEFIEEKDMESAYIALILLQKNSSFENALRNLRPYTNDDLEVSAYEKAFAKVNELEKS